MDNILEKDIYKKMLKERIIFINEEIDNKNASEVVAKLLYLDSLNNEDIMIYINSPGGEVSAGLMIYDTIRFIKSDVQTVAIGLAASMASIILMAGTKGKRKILEHGRVMLHDISGNFGGKYSDIVIAAKEMKKSHETIFNIIKNNTLLTDEHIKNNLKLDLWLTSDEALKLGIVDKIINN